MFNTRSIHGIASKGVGVDSRLSPPQLVDLPVQMRVARSAIDAHLEPKSLPFTSDGE